MPHKDEVKGTAKEARGHVKDAIGKATGDKKLRADGAADSYFTGRWLALGGRLCAALVSRHRPRPSRRFRGRRAGRCGWRPP